MMKKLTRPPSPDDAFAGASSPGGFREAPTYFEKPMLKRPHWGWNVVTYLFLGGMMGGSAIIAAITDPQKSVAERRLLRTANVTSLVLAAVCPLVLISHLGRPERFLNMLRIVKFKSPMSLGVWGLVLFSGIAGVSVIAEIPGLALLQAVLGGFIGSYTGVLISATAIPLWAKGKQHIPAISVTSGLASACALQSLLLPKDAEKALHKLERLELAASSIELLLLLDFERHAGPYGTPMFKGARGRKFKALTLGLGLAFPMSLNAFRAIVPARGRAARIATFLTSAAVLFGGYILRETFIEAGKASADDPHAAFAQPT